MNKIEKIKKVLQGEAINEVPFSFWTHFPEVDIYPEKIAKATYDFYKKYDLDFIKTMNNGMYAVEDYGCIVDHSEVSNGGVSKVVSTPINQYEDWKDLPVLDFENASTLHREITYLKKLQELIEGEVPIVVTIFSPLTIADKLSKGRAKEFLENDTNGFFKEALQKITDLTKEFTTKVIENGADGIYFASQLSTYERLTADEYIEFGRPYDLQVLDSAKDGWFNSIHLHGDDTMFDVVKDYPVHIINWHIGESFPGPKEGQVYSGKPILGGLNRWDINKGNVNAIHHQIYRTIFDTKGQGVILTPGCVIPQPFSSETINYIKKIKRETEVLVFDNSIDSSQL